MTSTIKVNTITTESGSTLTVGGCGKTVALASGASQTGFGRSGSVDWQTTPKTTTFTAADGEGYFINASGSITMNLPAGSAGAIVAVADYARNFATHNFIISPNGSEKIGGIADDLTLNVNGQALTLVYVDSTKGWINVQNAEDTETGTPPFIGATGGTETISGNCKIHTFTGPGTFTVNRIATCCAAVNNLVSYVVIAGGGGGGGYYAGGGGGAGGYREVVSPGSPYTGSPTQGFPTPGNRITVTATSFPITVGGGGTAGICSSVSPGANNGTAGGTSTFSTITSAGGGFGVGHDGAGTQPTGGSGGSGGGGTGNCSASSGGAGNTPSTTPAQGTNGGNAQSSPGDRGGGGGGGATAAGSNGVPSPGTGGAGGAGATSSINGTPTARAGGGGGGSGQNSSAGGAAGTGGGGTGGKNTAPDPNATDGTDNTGGGGGGASGHPLSCGGTGGSGVVIIRYRFQ
tara:strand:+ start:378 stop:1760 length:1383 start_codon:yes stop_codon:yes gene_type:complete